VVPARKEPNMSQSLAAAILGSILCGACGGGGGGDPKPPPTCDDLGFGAVPAQLVGSWQLRFYDSTDPITLHDDGTFVDTQGGGHYPGFWGLAEDGTFTAMYSLTDECPPTGTLMTAAGVTATDTKITGEIVSSPIAGLTGTEWSLQR
jgi:hypothetical protein